MVSRRPGGVNSPSLRALSIVSRSRARSARSAIYGSMSSAVNFCRANGGGMVGNGCVAQASSPGMWDFGTGFSSIGQSGFPVRAVEIVRSGTNWEVGNTALFVDCDLTPSICASDGLPRLFRPCVITELSRMRNGVKGPHQLSCQHVESAQVTGRGAVLFACRRSQDQKLFENTARRTGLDRAHRFRITPEPFS